MAVNRSQTSNISAPEKIRRLLNLAMISTMFVSLVLLFLASKSSAGCETKKIISRRTIEDSYYYTLSDQTGFWSTSFYPENSLVCFMSNN